MTKAHEAKLFAGGVPTAPQVDRLLEAFPKLDADAVIEHAEIEKTIREARGTTRYRSIVNAWRSRVKRAFNLRLEAIPGVGVKVLTEWDRVNSNRDKYSKGVRAIGRAATDMRMVKDEKLTPEQQRSSEHARRHIEATLAQARSDSKQIAVQFAPQQQLPRLKPVR